MAQRTLRLVIGFSPGSLSDRIAQVLADALLSECNVVMSIERHPGANGTAAARKVAAAVPDGTTLFMATLGTHALAPLMQQRPPYDPLRDFAAVSLLTESPMLLACHPHCGVASVGALIARAQQAPLLRYATSAFGGAPHLAAALFQSLTGTTMQHVCYDQTEQLYRDLEAGIVDLSFNNIASMLPRCRSGALTALGVSTTTRSAAAPELPALAEAGVPGFAMSNWTGLVAPAATPAALVEELGAWAGRALRAPAVAALLDGEGITPRGTSGAEFAAFMAAERARWGGVATRLRPAD